MLSHATNLIAPTIRGALFGIAGRLMVRRVDRLPADGERLDLREAAAGQLIAEVTTALGEYLSSRGALPQTIDAGESGRFIIADRFGSGPISSESGARIVEERAAGSAEHSIANRAAVVRERVAVVTGAAQGFGAEIAGSLAQAGAHVIVADLNLEGAGASADSINSAVGRRAAIAVAVDVSDEESVAAMVQSVVDEAGGIDLFVSNAGVLRAGSVKELSLRDFEFVTKVNYTGFFLCTKHAAPVMAAQTDASSFAMWSDIIQINSKSGLAGSNRNGAYAGGKFGGIGLVQSFAMELVEERIKVNAICPGNFFEGPLWSDPEKGLFVQYLRAGKVPGAKTIDDVKRAYESKVPMNRGCTGADVMRALLYIVEQEYETGQAIPVTGGQIMLR